MTASQHRPLGTAAAAREVLEAQGAREPIAVILAVAGPSDLVGGRVVVRDSASSGPGLIGSFGSAALDAGALEAGRQALDALSSPVEARHELTSEAGDGLEVYVEAHHARPDLVIVGAGHIAQPLCTVGALMGFRVIVIDDRPGFASRERFPEADRVVRVDFADPFADVVIHATSHVVLVTRGHKYDYECLRHLLRLEIEPPYIGMIGSRRRVRAAFSQLVKEGLDRDRLSRVRAPVGLDIGAETPAEIAVSVSAEIVHLWRGGAGAPLADKERVLHRFFKETGQ